MVMPAVVSQYMRTILRQPGGAFQHGRQARLRHRSGRKRCLWSKKRLWPEGRQGCPQDSIPSCASKRGRGNKKKKAAPGLPPAPPVLSSIETGLRLRLQDDLGAAVLGLADVR